MTPAAPIQCSTATGSIVGAINGSNTVFTITGVTTIVGAEVYRSGLRMTAGLDYFQIGPVITFVGGQTPQAGDIITASVFMT